MAQLLETRHTVTALAPGATVTFAPGLNDAAGVALVPNVVVPDRATAIRVVSATSALVTVTNDGTQDESAVFRTQQEFSTTCDPAAAGSQLLWQGLGSSASVGATGEYKQSVRAVTDIALPANTRVGNVLTANAPGALPTVDGVALVVGDRVLVKQESPTRNNGIYAVTDAGSGGTAWVLTRTPDADTSAEVTANMWTTAEEGTLFAHTGWLLATTNPITLNTTGLQFIKRFVFDLAGTYQNGAAGTSQNITLDTTRNGIQVRDSLAGIGADASLWSVRDNSGLIKFFDVISGTTGTKQYTYAGSSRIGFGADAASLGVTAATLLVVPEALNNVSLALAEHIDCDFDLSHTVTLNHTGSPLATERAALFRAPTYASDGVLTITTAATVTITGAPIAGAGPVGITHAYALWAQAGTIHADGNATNFEANAATTAGVPAFIVNNSSGGNPIQLSNIGTASGVDLFGVTAVSGYNALLCNSKQLVAGTIGAFEFFLGTDNTSRAKLGAGAEAAKSTQWYVSVNSVLKQVTVGANDSGGAGFSVLRVAN
jgi:hypothetical protein